MLRDQLCAQLKPGSERGRIRALVLTYLASYGTNDIEARLALFAENAIFEDPVGTRPVVGRSALRSLWSASSTIRVTASLQRIVVCGNEACYAFEAELDAGGDDRARISCLETIRVDPQGLIAEMRAYFDRRCIREPDRRRSTPWTARSS